MAGTTSSDDFETGTQAAAFGGTTTLVDFAIQPRGTKMRDALDTWWKKAENKACIDYGLHMIVTDLGEAGLEDMDDMVREGVASFKLFMAYPGVLQVDDATIFRALKQTAKNGALICLHAENGGVIDVIVQQALAEGKTAPIYHALDAADVAEAEAVHRAIAMSEISGAPVYIVHLSSEEALNEVRAARDRGVPAFAETCPQYLLLSIDELKRPGFRRCQVRLYSAASGKENLPKLWDGLKHDNLQVVSTDHCPFCFEDQKILGKDDFTKIPNGGPGIENRLQLLHHHGVNAGKISLNRFVEIVVHRAGEDFWPVSKEGRVGAGQRCGYRHLGSTSGASDQREDPHMRVDYSMFEGFRVQAGMPGTYFRVAKLIVEHGKFLGRAGRGEFSSAPRAAVHGSKHRSSPKRYQPLQRGSGPDSGATAHLGNLQLCFAVGRHECLYPYVHDGLRIDRRRHELETGRRHHFAGQSDRAGSHDFQRARRREIWHSIPGLRARFVWR